VCRRLLDYAGDDIVGNEFVKLLKRRGIPIKQEMTDLRTRAEVREDMIRVAGCGERLRAVQKCGRENSPWLLVMDDSAGRQVVWQCIENAFK